MSHNSNKIKKYMIKLFETYKEIQNTKNDKKFWDLIVLTTYDEEQKKCFEKQIQELMSHIPLLKDRIYVVADPENKKLGCGGSTLHVIKTLSDIFDRSLYSKRILIIHSGGSSQRLPSYSIQGKIFSPIPIENLISGSRVSYMLDLKLAMYLPFCNLLRPGIFVTCGDDIETFYLDPERIDLEQLKRADVLALAHPCDIETATGHGVYVLPEIAATLRGCNVTISDCFEVLQKPSINSMREKNAVFTENGEEKVYSDSVFWMSEKVYRSLLAWYKTITIDEELDAYGHFLPCLGIKAKSLQSNSFSGYKGQLLPLLRNFDFKLIILNLSKFYHLGTMEEYLFNFTDSSFCHELNIVKNTSTSSLPCARENNEENNVLIIVSYLSENFNLIIEKESQVIAEWSVIETPIRASGKLILSNCVIRRCKEVDFLQNEITCYGCFLYHTVPVRFNKNLYYVTVAYETYSNLKTTFSDFASIEFACVPIKDILYLGNIKESEAASDGKPFSLWNLRLFTAALTPEESFWNTHNFINKILNRKDENISMQTKFNSKESFPIFSMKQIIKHKDLDVFLTNRKLLIDRINSSKRLNN